MNFLCNVRRHKEYQLRFPTLTNPFKNVSPQQISLCVFTNYCFDSDVFVCFFALCSAGCCCAFNICPERLGLPLCESTHKSISHRHFFMRCIIFFFVFLLAYSFTWHTKCLLLNSYLKMSTLHNKMPANHTPSNNQKEDLRLRLCVPSLCV